MDDAQKKWCLVRMQNLNGKYLGDGDLEIFAFFCGLSQ
jgi:hypothetical protein